MAGRGTGWLCAILSDDVKRRATEIARDRGLTLTELMCQSVRAREGMLPQDKMAATIAELVNLAGRDYNEAAWAANLCARRYCFRVASNRESYKRFVRTLATCESMATESISAVADVAEMAARLEGSRWVVVTTKRGRAGRLGGARGFTFRAEDDLREIAIRSADELGLSVSAWLRGALLAYMEDCEAGEGCAPAKMASDADVRGLTLAASRWRVNHAQAVRSLTAVRAEQTPSRFDPPEMTERARASCETAMESVERAWTSFEAAMAPLGALLREA